MNQKKYNALSREYSRLNFDINEYNDMEPSDKQEFIDYAMERIKRIKEELVNEKSKNAIKNKQREVDKIENFLKQVDQEHEEEKPEETNSTDKGYEKFCKEGKNSPAYPDDINKKIYNFLKEQDLLEHYTVYDKENKCIYDISADCVKIATADMENGNLTISPNKEMIDEIKDAEKKALEEAKAAFKDEELVKVYINHNVMGENTIYGEFGKTSEKKVIPLKSFNFEPMDPFIEKMKHVKRVYKEKREKETEKKEQYETVVTNQSKNIYDAKEDAEETFAELFKKSQETSFMNQEEGEDIFHVDGLDFDIENFKGTLLMAIDSMEIDGWDPKSLELDFYDDGTGVALGKVTTNDGYKKEIIFGDIDRYNNFHVKADEEIFSQIGATDKPIDEKNLSVSAETEEKKEKTTVKKSKWEKPKEIDAYKVVMSDKGEFFMTLDSNGRIYRGGKPEHMLYAKSDHGKTIMKSLNEIAKVAGVEKDKLVVVDGCSYVTTIDGRQVGILSNDGHVLATENDIKEQQILYEFAKEKEVHIQGLHIDGNIIYSQTNAPLGYMDKSVKDLLGSNEKPKITIDEDNLLTERESYLADIVSENGIETLEQNEEEIDI